MKKRKLNTRKKNVLNIDELNAYRVAYGKPIGYKDYFKLIGLPSLAFGGLSFILLYKWWLSLIMILVGAAYGAKFFLPKSIEKQYRDQSFNERNKFINNMTQLLTDSSKTVSKALDTVRQRASGEFEEDISLLQARLLGANNQQTHESIKILINKYEVDVVFVQYMEQIETALIEGRANIDTLKDIKNYHNDIKKKTQYYDDKKQEHINGMKTIVIAMIAFILAINFSFGFNSYLEAFTNSIIGWIFSGIYLAIQSYNFIKFFNFYFDYSVMEVDV